MSSGDRSPPGPPAVVQTHCATVFFAGDRAYKVKRPLDLGFADFRTVASRQQACRREVDLNRRFAPDVYLGVAKIQLDGADEPCDWMVVMRRMPAERRLSELITCGDDVGDVLRQLARQLAAHHASARRSPRIDAAGTPAGLRGRWTDNLAQMQQFRGGLLDPGVLDEVEDRALRYVDGRHALLQARVEAGLIRDGHGDLLADDVFCLPDGPRALDCLEFDDDLRSVDGLDDAACLAMDLERLGAPELGSRFVHWFCEFSGQSRRPSLVHHYIAYRAVVRLKVACIRAAQLSGAGAGAGGPVADRAGVPVAGAGGDQVALLSRIACEHLRQGEPRLILAGGSPATGKSTLSGGLADELGAVLIRADVVRKETAGLPPSQHAPAAWQSGLYTPASTQATYQGLLERARRDLAFGETVVLDATWSSAQHRVLARELAASAGGLVHELHCWAAPAVVRERLRARVLDPASGEPSDATPEIARQLEESFEPWPEAVCLQTEGPPEDTVRSALAVIGIAAPADSSSSSA